MKYAPWVAGAVVVLIALSSVIAVLLHPGSSRPSRPAVAVPGPAGTPGPLNPGSPAPPPVTPQAARGQAIYVVEQVSPIVSREDTLNESLGFESPAGRFRAVLPKGTPVRYARSVTFSTSIDNQKEIRIHVLRGRSENAAQNHSLGWVRVPD